MNISPRTPLLQINLSPNNRQPSSTPGFYPLFTPRKATKIPTSPGKENARPLSATNISPRPSRTKLLQGKSRFQNNKIVLTPEKVSTKEEIKARTLLRRNQSTNARRCLLGTPINKDLRPKKSFMQSANSFNTHLAPRAELAHLRLSRAHDLTLKNLIDHIKYEKVSNFKAELNKLNKLSDAVNNGRPITRSNPNLSLKRTLGEPLHTKLKETLLLPHKEADLKKKIAIINEARKYVNELISKINTTLRLKDLNDATNFATAELSICLKTKSTNPDKKGKYITTSIPLRHQESPTYNQENIDSNKFKEFFDKTIKQSQSLLEEMNYILEGQAGTLNVLAYNESCYPQIAYHSEKSIYYHLLNGGLENIVTQEFPTRGITPTNTHTFNGLTLRIHSTRAMCESCEAVTIGVKKDILYKLNSILTANNFPEIPQESLNVDISVNHQSKRTLSLNKNNIVGIRQRTVSNCTPNEVKIYNLTPTRPQDFTYYTSGGEGLSPTIVASRDRQKKIIKELQAQQKEIWDTKEKFAALTIQKLFRGHSARITASKRKVA